MRCDCWSRTKTDRRLDRSAERTPIERTQRNRGALELYAQIVRTLYAHGTNCELYAHFVRAPFYVTQVASVRRPHPQTTIGEFCFCAQLICYIRSILTNEGVLERPFYELIDVVGGTAQIGLLFLEISRFFLLDAFGWHWTYFMLCSLNFNK